MVWCDDETANSLVSIGGSMFEDAMGTAYAMVGEPWDELHSDEVNDAYADEIRRDLEAELKDRDVEWIELS